MKRSMRLMSLSEGSPPPGGQRSWSGIVAPRLADLALQPCDRAMLRDANRSGGATYRLGGLFGTHADHHAEDEDLALLLGQSREQPVHAGRGLRVDRHLLRA